MNGHAGGPERRAFDAIPASAGAARRYVADLLRLDGAPPAVISDYSLVVSELVTNVIEHSARFTVGDRPRSGRSRVVAARSGRRSSRSPQATPRARDVGRGRRRRGVGPRPRHRPATHGRCCDPSERWWDHRALSSTAAHRPLSNRPNSFLISAAQSTRLASPTQIIQRPIDNGVVSNALLRKPIWTTPT